MHQRASALKSIMGSETFFFKCTSSTRFFDGSLENFIILCATEDIVTFLQYHI